jgi:hypothetical protein
MTSHSIQLDPPIEVIVDHGNGWAIFYTDYGPGLNAVWTVALDADGSIKHYQTIEVRLRSNYTFGLKRKIKESETQR